MIPGDWPVAVCHNLRNFGGVKEGARTPMRRHLALAAFAVALSLGLSAAAEAATHEPFFKGKTLRIIVGYAPGGGFDTYARAIARHMWRHVPGNPTIIVENMPGAGGLITANHIYKVAKPDGVTIGHFIAAGLFTLEPALVAKLKDLLLQ